MIIDDKEKQEIDKLVSKLKDQLSEYYKKYEQYVNGQLDEIDKMVDTFFEINKDRLESVNKIKEEVVDIVNSDESTEEKINKIKSKFENLYKKLDADLTNLNMLNSIDHLTKLFNRRKFDKQLEQFISYNGEISLIILDIDHFKMFNDTYGHIMGDQFLKVVSGIIKRSCENLDNYFPARFGGEEFVIILRNTSLQKAFQVAEIIRTNVSKYPFMIKDDNGNIKHKDICVTVSLGVANHLKGETPTQLIEKADKALYQAKNSGRNKTCMDS